MDSEDVVVPGARDVRGTLDNPGGSAAVVACPPHPQFGGTRGDRRLVAVAEALADAGGTAERDSPGMATLRFDYGDWDEGRGEQTDAENALAWARERYDQVALFGYSFGAMIALRATADAATPPAALAVLAPDAKAVDALDGLDCPLQVQYGARDETVDWAPVVERARKLESGGGDVEVIEWAADHHFVGQHDKVGKRAATFLWEWLGD
jgi:alpha/beta superfamily hydrolase